MQDVVERVRDYLGRDLGTGAAKQSRIARTLGMSPRTLQRRLREEGIQFRSLLRQVREERLRELRAASERLASEDTAHALGLSDPRSLRRLLHVLG